MNENITETHKQKWKKLGQKWNGHPRPLSLKPFSNQWPLESEFYKW